MALIDEIEVAAVWRDSNVYATNTSGNVLVSASRNGSGEELSDVYTLSVSARVGGTGTVTVSTVSKNNPYDGRVVAGVNFDDATIYDNIVPGVDLVFDNAAVNTNTATVEVGQYQGSFDASGVGAGVPTDGIRHRVTNDASAEVSDAKVRLLTQAVLVVIDHDVFSYISPFAEEAIEKTVGGGSDRVMPYKIEVSGVAGVGPAKTCTITIDGDAVGVDHIQDVTTGELQDGTLLKCVTPNYPYLFVDGPLKGLEFAMHPDAANLDEANIMIFNSRYTEIAEDIGGVEGTYGTTDVTLTEVGEAVGVISPAGVAYYWVRNLVPAAASNESNPHPCNIVLQASEAADAGWEV
jgi:hypothetical protein